MKLPFKFKVPDDPTRLLAAYYCRPVDPHSLGLQRGPGLRPLGPSSRASEPPLPGAAVR